jgi:type II secretory pathway pseudopilin PulG
MHHGEAHRRQGFTTIELLVVIGIIVALIGILIPVVGKVRESARATDTASWIQQLSGAIESYHTAFRAYPGPLSNDDIRAPGVPTATLGFVNPWPSEFAPSTGATTDGLQRITMAENLVLGLLGGLKPDPADPVRALYDPTLVGGGPLSLNRGAPKRYEPFIEPKNLSWLQSGGRQTGAFFDDASPGTGADDSIIPEFVDRYSDPMPILYLRARVGSQRNPLGNAKNDNPIITNNTSAPDGTFRAGQYDISQIVGYTRTNPAIGVGRKLPIYYEDGNVQNAPQWVHGLIDVNGARVLGPVGGGYYYPFDAFPYFRDPSLSNPARNGTAYAGPHVARQKDRFILISAGADRIYGTNDDITNFGPVVP